MPENRNGHPGRGFNNELLAEDIERVEELRYQISSKTYDSLRKKRRGKMQAAAEVDRQLGEMRRVFEEKNQKLRQAGLDYIILNKKALNNLREEFMRLSNAERDSALDGIGAGADIIDEMEGTLRKNFENKMEIARLILAFSSLAGDKSRIREALEGEHEFMVAELNGEEMALNEFFSAADELGFICKKNRQGKTMICRNEETRDEEETEDVREKEEAKPVKQEVEVVVIDIPGMPKTELQVRPPIQPQNPAQPQHAQQQPQHQAKPEDPQPQTRIQTQVQIPQHAPQIPQQVQQRQIPPQAPEEQMGQAEMKILETEHQKDLEEAEKREKELKEKVRLNVAEMQRTEVEDRMKRILTNAKMQRWVLNTFKDATEKEQYGKAQILLAALMKRKKELDETSFG